MEDDRTRTLIESATRGDALALDELVASCTPRLHAYVRLHMGPGLRAREASVDIVQSVCREVLEDIRGGFEYRSTGAFLRWLFSAALSKMRDRHKHHHRQRRSPDREGGPLDNLPSDAYATLLSPSREAVAREDVERLEAAFDQLPEQYREVITLSRIIGLKHAEIAEQLGRTPAAVRTMLGRAVARLSELHGGAE